MTQEIPVVFFCLKSPETPLFAKLLAGLAVGYALSPIDLIPDFIPVLGYLDDVLLLPTLIALTLRLIPPDTLRRCRSEAQRLWKNGRPKRWYYALPIVAVWLCLLLWVIRAVCR